MGCGINRQMKRVPTESTSKKENEERGLHNFSLYTVKEVRSELEQSCKPSNRESVV